jgi:hypothetical protein
VQAARVGPKLWLENRLGKARLRVGADMLASVGKIVDPLKSDDRDDDGEPPSGTFDAMTVVNAPQRPTDSSHIRNPIYRSAAGRNAVGTYAELTLPFADSWEITAGLRGDVWITGHDAQKALEPRLVLTQRPHPRVTWHGAFGLAYQPSVFLIPLPALADVALDRGLQRAIQSELGTLVELPASFSLDTKLYAHFYKNLLSFDAIDNDQDVDCSIENQTCNEAEGFARMSAYSYGTRLRLACVHTQQSRCALRWRPCTHA